MSSVELNLFFCTPGMVCHGMSCPFATARQRRGTAQLPEEEQRPHHHSDAAHVFDADCNRDGIPGRQRHCPQRFGSSKRARRHRQTGTVLRLHPATSSSIVSDSWVLFVQPLTSTHIVWYGTLDVCEGAPVAMGGWVLTDRHSLASCASHRYVTTHG